MDTNLISVIIPVYNREDYIRRCVDSVLEQDNVNIEIILVDDGSTDASSSICDMYSEYNKNITTIHQYNKGLSAARNAGLDICKGQYIFFVDSDDFIKEGTLYKLLQKMKETESDIVIGKYSRYYEDGTLEYENHIPENLRNRVLDKEELLSLMYIENSYLWCVAWGKIYKREVFENIRFPIGKNSEDEYIMSQILEQISRVYLFDEELYHQTLSRKSIVRSSVTIKKLDSTEAILVMIDYLLKHYLYDLALFRFGVGTRHLMKWKSESKDKVVLEGIKNQYKQYRRVAKRLIPHVNYKTKIRLLLFCFSFKLYSFLRKTFK